MKLVFRGHDDRYAVEQSLLAFFPEERPVYQEPEPGEDNWARVDLHQGPVYATATTEIAHGGRLGRGTSRALLRDVTDEYERERLRQKAVKLSFFKAARSITGVTPAWGALTGIRPGKLAARLLALVIPRTPVGQYPKGSGKKGGTLRRGWTAKTDEEAATGTSNGALVYYLYRHGLVELDKVYTVVQGEKMGRPSMISAQVILKDGQPFVKVGGPAVTLVRGEIEL